MSMVIPDGQVWLCSNVPFDTNYNQTKWYSSQSTQFNDISSKAVFTANECRYIKENMAIRLSCPATTAYKVNYLIYKNTSFENKYFYAFVIKVNYINNDVYEFVFVTDVIQTWLLDYTLDMCYIEREHIANDVRYASRTIENLETGDFAVDGQFEDSYSRTYKICVVTTFKRVEGSETEGTETSYEMPDRRIYGKTYCGLQLNFFNDSAGATAFIDIVTREGKDDGIVGVMMCPKAFSTSVTNKTINIFPDNYGTAGSDAGKETSHFGGYTPKNNKLYNYPFRFVRVLNGRGTSAIYKWEDAIDADIGYHYMTFTEYIGGYNNPEILLSANYNNAIGSNIPNPAHVMTNGGTIPCSWTNDAYQAWLAQNQGQLNYAQQSISLNKQARTIEMGASVAKGLTSVLTQAASNPLGAVGTAANTAVDAYSKSRMMIINEEKEIAKLNATMIDHEILPPESQVVSSSGQLAQDSGLAGFTFQYCSIRKEYAKIIDDYFTKYGYACHEIKSPAHYTRKAFNYIQTVGATARGSVPADDLRAIQDIYNKGITFWHTSLNSIGDYTLNNGSI